MKKITISLLAVSLILSMCLGMTAFAEQDTMTDIEGSYAFDPGDAGVYYFTYALINDEEFRGHIGKDDYYVTVFDDGTAQIYLYGEVTDCVISGNELISEAGTGTYSYIINIDNGVLSLDAEGAIWFFSLE